MEEVASSNYWTNPSPPPNKKKVTFDDILTNLNLIVDKNTGVLQYIQPKTSQVIEQQTQKVPMPRAVPMPKAEIKKVVLPTNNHQTQNSYIYNKYFKNYKDEQVVEEKPQIPMTREQLKKHLLIERARKIIEMRRVEQIKSKKMFLNTTISSSKQNVNQFNKFFM